MKTGSMLLQVLDVAAGELEEAAGEDKRTTVSPLLLLSHWAGAVNAPGAAHSPTPASAQTWREITSLRHLLSAGMLHGQHYTGFVPLPEHIVI